MFGADARENRINGPEVPTNNSRGSEREWESTIHAFKIFTGRNTYHFNPAIKNVQGFRVIQTGFLDYNAPNTSLGAFWRSDSLQYWIQPRCTMNGLPTTLIAVGGLINGGYIIQPTKYHNGRIGDLKTIDLTVVDMNGTDIAIDPANPAFIVIELYVIRVDRVD